MAVQNFRLMRGLYIPDANFSWSSDLWTLSSIDAADVVPFGPGLAECPGAYVYGSGRSIRVDLSNRPTTHGTDLITSTYTPREIAAGPWSSGTLRVWIGMICATAAVTNAARALVRFTLQGYAADGTVHDALTVTPTKQDGSAFLVSNNAYILIDGVAYDAAMHADVRWYKLIISLVQPDGGGGAGYLSIDWVGVGVAFEADGEDNFSGWYAAQAQHSSRTSRHWHSDAQAEQPHIQVKHRGIHQAEMSLAFPYLSSTDKSLMQKCWAWNAGTPTDDVTGGATGYHTNRGTAQPVLVIPDREDAKRAFYADFASEPVYTQATGAPAAPYWPETSALWATNCTFRERL